MLCITGLSDSVVHCCPSRYQEGLKKTKELQDLKEEEGQKGESPEEPGRGGRSRKRGEGGGEAGCSLTVVLG